MNWVFFFGTCAKLVDAYAWIKSPSHFPRKRRYFQEGRLKFAELHNHAGNNVAFYSFALCSQIIQSLTVEMEHVCKEESIQSLVNSSLVHVVYVMNIATQIEGFIFLCSSPLLLSLALYSLSLSTIRPRQVTSL